jgi:hypothetical protein
MGKRYRRAGESDALDSKGSPSSPGNPLLLVYLNISTGGRLGDEVERTINALKDRYADDFREICVLWASKLY